MGGRAATRAADDGDGPLRVLFVGGDLARKGGLVLARRGPPRCAHDGVAVELDLVTRDDVAPRAGHHVSTTGLAPNSPALIELYHRADVFCLPTLGDCLPMVLSEAGAVGLPLVSTDVGAIGEIVRDGATGLLVPVGDADALAAALRPPRRRRRRCAGSSATRRAASSRAEFDAATNARRLVELLRRRRARADARDATGAAHRVGDDPRRPRRGDRRRAPAARRLPRDGRARSTPTCSTTPRRAGRPAAVGRLLGRVAGANALLAWACFRRRKQYRVVFTDGEQVGLPYAALTLARPAPAAPRDDRPPAVAAEEGRCCTGCCGCSRRIDTVVVYASAQRRFAIDALGYPPEQVVLTHVHGRHRRSGGPSTSTAARTGRGR